MYLENMLPASQNGRTMRMNRKKTTQKTNSQLPDLHLIIPPIWTRFLKWKAIAEEKWKRRIPTR